MPDLGLDLAEQRFHDSELVRKDFLSPSRANVNCDSSGDYSGKQKDAENIRTELLDQLKESPGTHWVFLRRVSGRLFKQHPELEDIEQALEFIGRIISRLLLEGYGKYREVTYHEGGGR